MREVIFIKSLCQGIVLFLYKTVNFKTTTESLGKNSCKIPLCDDCLKVELFFFMKCVQNGTLHWKMTYG